MRKPPISVTSTSLPERLRSVFSKDLPLSNSNVTPRSAAGGAGGAQPPSGSPCTFSQCQRRARLPLQPPAQPSPPGSLAQDPARGQGSPTESAWGSRPGLPEGRRSWVGRGRPERAGRGLTASRGRRPHLDPDLIGGEAASADPHRLRVAHIDLKEVAGRPVGVIQVLRLGDQPPGIRHRLRHVAGAAAAASAASAGSLRPRRVPPPPPLLAAGTPGSRAAVARRTST